MHSLHTTPAIVLRSWPFGESDKIVCFLTEHYGKVTGIAKGAKRSRKRFVNTLELFSLVNLRFQDRPHGSMAFIHACDLIRPFRDITTSLEKIAHASYLVEVADGLVGEREENQPLFQHLREGLVFIEEMGTSLAFVTFFELKILKLSGYQPMLERCRRCGMNSQPGPENRWCFSPADGGILCDYCSTLRKGAVPLSSEALCALVKLQQANGNLDPGLSLPPLVLREIRAALCRFMQFQTNRALKSASFLEAFPQV